MNKKDLSERDIITQFIMPAIKKAGWNIERQVREEVYFTDGRIYVRGNKTARGERKFADIILYHKSNIPIAIKEIEISHNEYLRNGLRKLAEIEGSLLIIGSSLADNDAHIFEKVNQSKIQRIFIASCEKDKAKDYRNARKFWSEKEVALFDRDTVSYAK